MQARTYISRVSVCAGHPPSPAVEKVEAGELRQNTCDRMFFHPTEAMAADLVMDKSDRHYDPEALARYIQCMRQAHVRGGEHELEAAASVLRSPVKVYGLRGNELATWTYSPEQAVAALRPPVKVLYVSRNHYDLLVEVDEAEQSPAQPQTRSAAHEKRRRASTPSNLTQKPAAPSATAGMFRQ